ncbi:unnamed protein product [Bemisia tabaci]|uniref:Uncharacterized protein n=2 Tax=Bemisia tabaci TaxID=7038 RepID=A0A9N9ZZ90_BEMTA|nr:unnamed protein product [Bemisia tabaci]
MERQPSSPRETSSPRKTSSPRQSPSPRQTSLPRQTSSFNKKGSGTSIWSSGLKYARAVKGKIKERTYSDALCVEYCKEQNGYFLNTSKDTYELVSTFGRAYAYGVTCSCNVSNNFKQFIIKHFNDETVEEKFVSWWGRGFPGKKAKIRLNALAENHRLTTIEFLTSGELREKTVEETSKLRRQRSDEKKVELKRQASLTRRLENLTTDLEKSRAEVALLQDQLKKKDQEIARTEQEGRAKIGEIKRLEVEIKSKTDSLKKNEEGMAKLKEDLSKIERLYDQKCKEFDNLSEQLLTSQTDLQGVKDELRKTDAALRTSREEADKLKAEVERMRAEANKPFLKRMCGLCFGGGATKSPARKQKKPGTNGKR